MNGKQEDVAITANDIVIIPNSRGKSWAQRSCRRLASITCAFLDAELSAIPDCLNGWSQIEVLHEKAVRSSHPAALFSVCNCVALVFGIACLAIIGAVSGATRNAAGALTMSRLPALTPTPAPKRDLSGRFKKPLTASNPAIRSW